MIQRNNNQTTNWEEALGDSGEEKFPFNKKKPPGNQTQGGAVIWSLKHFPIKNNISFLGNKSLYV